MAVLIVEDEAILRLVTAETFRDFGFKVYEAASYLEARAVIDQRNDVRAVFTDIEMPGAGNGLSLAHYIRRTRPELLIFITSGRLLPMKEELPPGTRFLAKPYNASDIALVVDDIRQSLD